MATYYNLEPLDKFLNEGITPEELADSLDETMAALVDHAGKDDHYHQELFLHYDILRELRNIFWELKKAK